MDIQMLDGIDIQMLDGAPDPRMGMAMSIVNAQMRKDAERGAFLERISGGYTNMVGEECDNVAGGVDFAGYTGEGTDADDEMLRNYLERTKRVVDASPSTVMTYQNPAELSGMLGYVLDRWDSEEREQAIDDMAEREQRLMAAGLINTGIVEDYDSPTAEDYTVVDNYDPNALNGLGEAKMKSKRAKGGFFSAIKMVNGNAALTTEAKDITAADPVAQKLRGKRRKAAAATRRVRTSTSVDVSGNVKKTLKTAVAPEAVNGMEAFNANEVTLMNGSDLEYMVNGDAPADAIFKYLCRSMDVAKDRPDLFDDEEDRTALISAYEMVIAAWYDEKLRNAALDSLSGIPADEAGPMGGFLKKLAKNVKNAVKKVGQAVKNVAKKVGSAFKKLGKAIKKVAKKVWKFIVRFNPLTLLIRAGILAIVRLNMFKLANKCYAGSLTKEEAKKQNIPESEWETSNKCYATLKKVYVAIGGKESKLKNCLKKGCKKKWDGPEYPDANGIKAAAKNATDPEVTTDQKEERAELEKSGAKADDNAPTNVATDQVKVQVEVIENERTVKAATPIRETGETSGKVLANVPKGAKVLVDTKQGDATWIAVTYGNHNGWMLKSQLAGLDGIDAESVVVMGLGAIWDNMGEVRGLGDPATGTAITAATSTVASIVAKIKDICKAVGKVVSKVVNVVKKGSEVVNKVKDKVDNVKSAVKNNPIAKAVSTVKNTVQDAKKTVQQVKTTVSKPIQTVKNAVNTVKSTAQNVKNTAQQVKATVSKPVQTVKNAVNTVKSTAQNVKNTAQQVKNTAKSAAQSVRSAATAAASTAATAAAAQMATRTAAQSTAVTQSAPQTAVAQSSAAAPQAAAQQPTARARKMASRPMAAAAQQAQTQQGMSPALKYGLIAVGVLGVGGIVFALTRKPNN